MNRVRLATVMLVFAVPVTGSAQEITPNPPLCDESRIVPYAAPAGPQGSGWWYAAGSDAVLLVPRYESSSAYTIMQFGPGPAGTTVNVRRIDEFGYAASFSPRLWASAGVGDTGVRVTWFGFNQSAKPKDLVNAAPPIGSPVLANMVTGNSPLLAIGTPTALPAVNSIRPQGSPLPPDRLSFTNSLKFDFWDLDATFSDLRIGRWDMAAFGGLRYAYVQQTYSAFAAGLPPQQLLSTHTFNGVGPTAGGEARRPFGTLGLSAYGKVRFAFLFGTDEQQSNGQTLGTVPPLTLTTNDDASSRERYAPWVDLELGVEWSRRIGAIDWSAHSGVFTSTFPLGGAASGNGNIGLIGLNLGASARY